jgi:Flp pilus assembly pilin Flp
MPPISHHPVVAFHMLVLLAHRSALTFIDWCSALADRVAARCRDERGQATTEYALVLLAAALVALLVVAWATAGGGAAKVSRLFNRVIDAVIDRV